VPQNAVCRGLGAVVEWKLGGWDDLERFFGMKHSCFLLVQKMRPNHHTPVFTISFHIFLALKCNGGTSLNKGTHKKRRKWHVRLAQDQDPTLFDVWVAKISL